MLDLLPQIDAYIRMATGRDWTVDSPVNPLAKSAARMVLVMWYENPGMMAGGATALNFGLTSALTQLEAWARRYRRFQGLSSSGPISLPGACAGDTVSSLTGLIGCTGDQSAAFETVISVDDQIQQVTTVNLSKMWFVAYLVPLEGL